MNCFGKSTTVSDFTKKEVFQLPSDGLINKAKIQFGGQSPTFRKLSIEDKGKVRLGGQGPIFRV